MEVDTFNPILNSPYEEPSKYYFTGIDGTLDYEKIQKGRRPFLPEMPPIPITSKDKNLFDLSDFGDSGQKHLVNIIRNEVGKWRNSGYLGTTAVTRELLEFWFNNKELKPRIFFAQREAIETVIWLNEIGPTYNAGSNILNRLIESSVISKKNTELNIPRFAFKMATGSGKTVVMALIILYNFFNRLRYPSDTRFADYFLVITPGITVKERLGVLYQNKEARVTDEYSDYYRKFDLVPQKLYYLLDSLNTKIIVTNYHSFEPKTFQGNKRSPFDGKAGRNDKESKEDSNISLRRVLGKFKRDSRLLIINDEAHHCYYPQTNIKGKTKNTEEDDADDNKRAAVWFTGLTEVCKRYKVGKVFDFSATPYFLTGSGYPPYTLFPWIVTDFGLVESIESGLVKIPFIPESDTTHNLDMPVLRNLYDHVKDELPKKGRRKAKEDENDNKALHPFVPTLIKNALDQFYSNYEKEYEKYRGLFDNPPVFIVVCNNTSVSAEIFKYIAGYEIVDKDGTVQVVNGRFKLFDNFDPQTKKALNKPPTLLIDSDALEHSEQISDQFKKVFAPEIENFKRDFRISHPEKSIENITEAEILREVVNTVGKKGKLGAHIRCVVSVSMLTEGWDANTVTHIMGIRAFGSQLLCEQVAGRALRRVNYLTDKKNKFTPEYAQIIGIPFSFFKKGATVTPVPPENFQVVQTIPERANKYEINFPNVIGYRLESESEEIKADFSKIEPYELDGTKYPTETKMANAFSPDKELLTLDQIKDRRMQELVFSVTKTLISLKYSDENNSPKFYLFNSLKNIVEEWITTKVKLLGDAYINMLFYESENKVCEHIMRGIYAASLSKDKIVPVLNFHDKFGSTKYVFGRTTRKVYPTKKSHVNYVVADTESWEQIAAKTLDEMTEVTSYVKNAFLGFKIPYVHPEKDNPFYYPDFIAKCKTKRGTKINLIIEITGMNQDKAEKKWYLENRWIPAVNNVKDIYGYDDWQFIEIAGDISDIKNNLKNFLNSN